MNKFKTDINGRLPITLNDLRWIEGGISNALKAVFDAYGEDKFIISGCEFTINSGYRECSEGFIYWEGEILYTPGGSAFFDESNIPVFELEVTYDPAGLKLFKNGVQNDTYEIRRAKYYSVNYGSTSGKLIALSAKRLSDLMADLIVGVPSFLSEIYQFIVSVPTLGSDVYPLITGVSYYGDDVRALAEQSSVLAKKQQGAWTVVTPSNQFTFAGINSADQLKHRLDEFGNLQLIGAITGAEDPDGYEMCQIPNCTPPSERLMRVFVNNNGLRVFLPCWLETDGKIRIKQTDGHVYPGGIAYLNETIPLD